MPKKIIDVFKQVCDEIIANKQYLTKLDSAIGDGDHGINMARGFSEVKEVLNNDDFDTNSEVLKKIGMTLISNVGGASGPLYGTAFLRAGKVIKEDIDLANLVEIGKAVIEGVKSRGKANQGDKTMLDTLIPVHNYLKESHEVDTDLEIVLKECLNVAEKAKENTKPIIAKKGRASYLGERSKGHLDPGATSSCMIIKVMINEIL